MRTVFCLLWLGWLGFFTCKAQGASPAAEAPAKRDLPQGLFNSGMANRNDLRLYPNPAAEGITIEGFVVNVTTRVEVRDALGKTVMLFSVETAAFRIDISTLEPGIYFVTINDAQSDTRTLRFVKE